MKKNIFVALSSLGILAIAGTVCFATLSPNGLSLLANGNPYEMTFNDKSQIVALDDGYLHEYEIKNNLVDFIGWEEGTSDLGVIKQKTHTYTGGSTTYRGMVFNKSIINGFISLKVNFTGGSLYYKFTDYLMEDMNFTVGGVNTVTSNTAIQADGKPYFILYTDSTTGVNLESIHVEYECDGSIDSEFIFDKNTNLGGARSISKSYKLKDSFIEMESNPLANTNCYSTGTNPDSGYSNTWYRWNGREFNYTAAQHSAGAIYDLGDNFDIHTTILGNISQAVYAHTSVEDNYFHFAVWPEFSINNVDPADDLWVTPYIGNDNYEPLGKDDPNRVHTSGHGNYSYAGRFFAQYIWLGGTQWEFGDPDVLTTLDGSKTLRQAYEAFNLPFWHLKFAVANGVVTTYINGFALEETMLKYEEVAGEDVNTYDPETDSLSIWRWPMMTVNYADTDRNPAASYKSLFTYPRIVKY